VVLLGLLLQFTLREQALSRLLSMECSVAGN
jgi:hypothetical protein